MSQLDTFSHIWQVLPKLLCSSKVTSVDLNISVFHVHPDCQVQLKDQASLGMLAIASGDSYFVVSGYAVNAA